jgi:perosamine synthetase
MPRARIALHNPEIGEREWESVRDCLQRGWISSAGEVTEQFERRVADYVGIGHGVAVSSGTSALHVSLLVAGVGAGDEVVVPSLTFIASVNAIAYCGAAPVFIDCTPESWTLDPAKTVAFLREECDVIDGVTRNRRTGRRLAAILAVHVLGHPVDLDPVLEEARPRGIPVIEDAAESLGARYKGRAVGAIGDIASLSFNGSKIVTTGGGGMVLTNVKAWAQRARHLTTQARTHRVEYIHDEIGFNYRLPAVNAAIGIAQMERLPDMLARKRRLADVYSRELGGVRGLRLPIEAPWALSTYWLYTVRLDAAGAPGTRDRVLACLHEAGIEARPVWRPIHLLPMYAAAQRFALEYSDAIYETAISLPSSPGLTHDEQAFVTGALRQALEDRPAMGR